MMKRASVLAMSVAMASVGVVQAGTYYCVHDDGLNDSQFCFIDGTPAAVPFGPVHNDCDIESLDITLPENSSRLYASAGDDTQAPGHLYLVNKATAALTDLGKINTSETPEVDAISFHPETGELWGWDQHAGLFRIGGDLPTTGKSVPAAGCKDPSSELIPASIVFPVSEWEVEDITWNWEGTALYAVKNCHNFYPEHDPDGSHDHDADGDNQADAEDDGPGEDGWPYENDLDDLDFAPCIELWVANGFDLNGTGLGSVAKCRPDISLEVHQRIGNKAEIEALEAVPRDAIPPNIPVQADSNLVALGLHGPEKILYLLIEIPPVPPSSEPIIQSVDCPIRWDGDLPAIGLNDIEGIAYTTEDIPAP